jgi:hypothetical protein
MATYRNTVTGEVRDLYPALIESWRAANNPKATQWEPYTPPVPPPPPPAADWDTFVAWLYQFPPIATGMSAARLSTDPQGEPATTGLPTALDEARLRQNYPAFSLAWGLFLLASQMAPADLAAIVGKASDCHLPAEFLAALQPSLVP